MNRVLNDVIGKKATELAKAAEEEIVISRKVLSLEIAVALLGGIILGMIISPRKKVSYKIASNNNINADDEYDEEEDDVPEDETDGDEPKNGKFIKL